MKITVSSLTGDFCSLAISDDMDFASFCALVSMEMNFPSGSPLVIMRENTLIRPSSPSATVQSLGIQDGDILLVSVTNNMSKPASGSKRPASASPSTAFPGIDFSNIRLPGTSSSGSRGTTPTFSPAKPSSSNSKSIRPPNALPGADELASEAELFRQSLLSNPAELAMFRDRNPPLAALIHDRDRFIEKVRETQRKAFERAMEIEALATGNPYDPQVQAKIEDLIRQQNIENELMHAMEHHPEHFARVSMLYINCQVFGHPIKAFVDSGAEATIMSEACAKRCNVERLIDKRFAGIAKGVGTQKITGRVHSGVIQIGPDHLATSFTVLQDQQMDLLLGLDMLKRHQCCIDLKRNVLIIGTTGSETSFLPESELPFYARLNYEDPSGFLDSGTGESSSPSPMTNANVDPVKVEAIKQQGFSKEAAEKALRACNGDLDSALARLLAKSFEGDL